MRNTFPHLISLVTAVPGYREKRHDGPHPSHTSSSSNSSDRDLRCSHIMIPEMIVSTPAIGDLDKDGRLEIAYLVSWRTNSRSSEEVVIQDLPPHFTVFVETLETRVKEEMGEEEGENSNRGLTTWGPGGTIFTVVRPPSSHILHLSMCLLFLSVSPWFLVCCVHFTSSLYIYECFSL